MYSVFRFFTWIIFIGGCFLVFGNPDVFGKYPAHVKLIGLLLVFVPLLIFKSGIDAFSVTKTDTISKNEATAVQNSISTPPKTKSVEVDNGDISWYQHCYRVANGSGKSEAWFELGECYNRGRGVPFNIDYALVCYRKSAAQGNSRALSVIGSCYLYGRGVPKDVIEAYAYFCLSGGMPTFKSGNQIVWCVDYLTPYEVRAGKARANELSREIGF